jgi:hypothetical protein
MHRSLLGRRARTWLAIGGVAILCESVGGQNAPAWPDTYEARLQALALIQTLNARILSSRSATTTLEGWCRDHKLADTPVIAADQVRGTPALATPEQRQRLKVSDREPITYRRVRLRCGARVLSEAETWYVPARLTAEMNQLLQTSDTPFGRAVAALEPYRQTFAASTLWSPLPDGWETANGTGVPASSDRVLAIPDALFAHRAVLYTREHLPFAEVSEIYQRQLLAFPPPRRPQ